MFDDSTISSMVSPNDISSGGFVRVEGLTHKKKPQEQITVAFFCLLE